MSTSLYPFKLKDSVALGVLVCLNLSIYANAVLNEQLTAIVFSKAAQRKVNSSLNVTLIEREDFFVCEYNVLGVFISKLLN